MSRSTKHLPPKFLKNIEEVTYIVRGSQVIRGLDELPFHVTVRAEKHRRLSFNIKEDVLHISEKETKKTSRKIMKTLRTRTELTFSTTKKTKKKTKNKTMTKTTTKNTNPENAVVT